MVKVIHEDYSRQIDEFEKTLERVATDITSGAIFERLPPMELWERAEALVTRLQSLAEGFKGSMLILKPEKILSIEKLYEGATQPLKAFKEILFQETTDPLTNSRLALEELRKAMVGASDLTLLAKAVRDNPSPIIKEVLRLREVYEAKEYIATVQAPKVLEVRLDRLTKSVEALSASLANLEETLNAVKEKLGSLREESAKFRSTSVEYTVEAPEKKSTSEEKGQPTLSKF